jgi:CDP-diacylglycerol pyrophosphatase
MRSREFRWRDLHRSIPVFSALAAILLAGAAAGSLAPPRGSSALWDVVHDLCVPDRKVLGAAAPCMAVDRRQGWAVVKDPREPTHILLVPTRRVSGIESPGLLVPGAHDYWADAWRARRYFDRLVGRHVPRQDIALVVNSVFGRTQNQLHIHIDCVKPAAARILATQASRIGSYWAPLAVPLMGYQVDVRRLAGARFAENPFQLLSQDPSARADMGMETLAAVGAVFPDGRPGFYLISHRARPEVGDLGSGEFLLDHTCEILRGAAAS